MGCTRHGVGWRRPCVIGAGLAVMLTHGVAPPLLAQQGASDGEWRVYAGDAGSTKYSPLDQITPDNFSQLEVRWRWNSPDNDAMRSRNIRPPRPVELKATPLVVGDRMYVSTGLTQVAALDARTGEQLWLHDHGAWIKGWPANTAGMHSRGVTYWSDGDVERVFVGTYDGFLLALNAGTGQPVADFGVEGQADLERAIPRADRDSGFELHNGEVYQLSSNSPPTICRNVVVVGSSISDRPDVKEWAPGHVQAFDVRTGEPRWTFHTIPQEDEFGVETWENESWRFSGSTNVWTMMSADEELGLVYLPTATPTSDHYGASRLGDNLFAESLVAVDCETGERRWHFQAVHHGVWDWDFPAAPNLVDITVDGRTIKAVAQISKQAFTYVFDRETGDPVWPIEERPVPQSDIPGERLSPTQPFPTRPPPFDQQGVSIDDLIDFTPALRREALENIRPYRFGPLFTPPSLYRDGGPIGTIQVPTNGGAANWGGAGVDPETGYLYVPSRTALHMQVLSEPGSDVTNLRYLRAGTAGPRSEHPDNPRRPSGPQGLPLFKPPYSRMTAIDLNTGTIAWQVPTGPGSAFIRNHEALRGLDLPPLGGNGRGGPLVTKTVLIHSVSLGPADGGRAVLVAYDKATGDVLSEVSIPGAAIGTPMTYMVNGTQYIALTVRTEPESLIALALP